MADHHLTAQQIREIAADAQCGLDTVKHVIRGDRPRGRYYDRIYEAAERRGIPMPPRKWEPRQITRYEPVGEESNARAR